MQRGSFLHFNFCAGGGRFRKRIGMSFIHCGTPSCRYLQRRSAHRVCALDFHMSIGKNLDKIISPRCQPTCLTALLSLSRTAYDMV